jgi:putative drug exporter of the RND superfamily
VSPDGSAARVLLVFYGFPFSSKALDRAQRLQDDLPALLQRSGLGDVTGVIGG